jgi:hypothetical protein
MADERPIQHTPKHLEPDADVFDKRHPAASQFAPGQPAAGVVADDVPPEQNPAGGPKAADAPVIEQTPPEPADAEQAAIIATAEKLKAAEADAAAKSAAKKAKSA